MATGPNHPLQREDVKAFFRWLDKYRDHTCIILPQEKETFHSLAENFLYFSIVGEESKTLLKKVFPTVEDFLQFMVSIQEEENIVQKWRRWKMFKDHLEAETQKHFTWKSQEEILQLASETFFQLLFLIRIDCIRTLFLIAPSSVFPQPCTECATIAFSIALDLPMSL